MINVPIDKMLSFVALILVTIASICYCGNVPIYYVEIGTTGTIKCPIATLDNVYWKFTSYSVPMLVNRLFDNESHVADPWMNELNKYVRISADTIHIYKFSYMHIGLYECSNSSTFDNTDIVASMIVRGVIYHVKYSPDAIECTIVKHGINWTVLSIDTSPYDDRSWTSLISNSNYSDIVSVTGAKLSFNYRSVSDNGNNFTVSCDAYTIDGTRLIVRVLVKLYLHRNLCTRNHPPYCKNNGTCTYDNGTPICTCHSAMYGGKRCDFNISLCYIGTGVVIGIICIGIIIHLIVYFVYKKKI